MSVSKVFSCDLCTGSVNIGSGRGLILDRDNARLVSVDLAEKHLCKLCLNKLAAMLAPARVALAPVDQEMERLALEEAVVDSPIVCRA